MAKRGPLNKLLTDEQEKAIKGEKELSDVGRRQANKVARDKLEFYLKSASDALLILDKLPDLIENLPDPEKEKFKNPEYIAALLDVVDKYLAFVDPWPIGETEEGDLLRSRTYASESRTPGKCYIQGDYMTALPEEIALWERLKDHAARLQYYIDPYLILPPGSRQPWGPAEWTTIERSRRPTMASINYLNKWRDVEGIGRAAPVWVDEEEVRRHKRWNPKPLPVKHKVAEDPRTPPQPESMEEALALEEEARREAAETEEGPAPTVHPDMKGFKGTLAPLEPLNPPEE